MKGFRPGKVIKRVVKIRSSDRAISDAEWILAISEHGIRIRRLGDRQDGSFGVSWRSVIGHALIHRAAWKPPIVAKEIK